MTMRQQGREPVEEPQRGVFEYDEAFDGTRTFRLVTRGGRCLMSVTVAESEVWEGFIDDLWHWLELHDPERPPLKIA